MSRGDQPQLVEVDVAAIQAMMGRAKEKLSGEDYVLLEGLVESLLYVVELIRKGRATIARLRRLIGIDSTEKTAEVLGRLDDTKPSTASASPRPKTHEAEGAVDANAKERSKPKGHGRLSASDYPEATRVRVAHESLHSGGRCPSCGRGTLYSLKEPARLLRIVGQAPLVAVCWELREAALQRLRPRPHGRRPLGGEGPEVQRVGRGDDRPRTLRPGRAVPPPGATPASSRNARASFDPMGCGLRRY